MILQILFTKIAKYQLRAAATLNEPSILIGVLDSLEPEEIWINARTNVATELAAEENKKKEGISPENLVPEEYHEYLDIFDEGKVNRFPEERPWDHKIEMKEGFEPKSFKNYNLTPEEQLEQYKFLKENLEKGYIRPSQSPMASPFFRKKERRETQTLSRLSLPK